MDITATIIEIMETVNMSATFKKREIVVEYDQKGDGAYTEMIKFEAIQDKCDILDSFQVGQQVNIAFNLKGRKWTNPQGEAKYFNSLQLWKINDAQQAGQMQGVPPAPYQQPVQPIPFVSVPAPAPNLDAPEDSIIPF